MPSENWESVNIYAPMMDDVRQMIKLTRRYPNASQYINEAIRRALDEDKTKLISSEVQHG